MGVSTDGLLFWGIAYDEDEIDESISTDATIEYLSEMGIELGIHCSFDYPMYFLAPKILSISANRGYPKDATPLHFALERGDQAEWREKLKAVTKELSLEWHEPQLWLASLWG